MTTSLRDRVIDRLLEAEGGLSNHAADRGGLTNLGLTKQWLKWVTGRDWTDEDVRRLDAPTARGLITLWLRMTRLDQLPEHDLFAWVVVDFALHSGHRTAIKAVQKAMGVPDDGIAGAETQGRWHLLTPSDCRAVAVEVVVSRLRLLGRLITADPTQAAFAAGWMNRVGYQVKACLA